jgi:hypothetical protein
VRCGGFCRTYFLYMENLEWFPIKGYEGLYEITKCGKGIKQILDCAKKHEFSKFTIIANDQIINVKDQNSNSLNCNFDGTFIHFEITYSGQK